LPSDLNEDDRKCLQSGLMPLIPAKDVAGCGVMTWTPLTKEGGFSVRSKTRLASDHSGGSVRFEIQELNGVVVVSLCCADALLDLFVFCSRRG
jgi:hypothetical protein